MALDFHLAKTEKEAPYQKPFCSFEIQSHSLLFERVGLPDGQFPLLTRLRDYYQDARYSKEELDALVQELDRIKVLFTENETVVEQMDIIFSACKKAKREQLGIWVYCD